ncbi:MAG: hypothetical protein R2741_09750 [Methanolobus sp.]
MKLLPYEVTVKIQGRDVRIRAWIYEHFSLTKEKVPVIFLIRILKKMPRKTGR